MNAAAGAGEATTAALAPRLERWLATNAAFGPEARLVRVEDMAGGQSSDMMRMICRMPGAVADETFIIRREPRARQLFLKPDVVREYRVIEGVGQSGTVPIVPLITVEPDESVLDAPFFVMREIEGFAPMGRPSLHVAGPLKTLTLEARARLWDQAMNALVAIHALDWRTTHPFLIAEYGEGDPLSQYIDKLGQWYQWTTQGRPFPITDQALAYLQRGAAAFADEPSVLLWNDARVGNMMFTEDGTLQAVIDWEGSIVGPRGLDIGYWMMMDAFQAESIGVARVEGWPSEAETLARYEALSGHKITNIDYFIVMAAFFIATTLIRQADLGAAAGRFAANTRMGHDNSTTQIIAARLGLPLPDLSPDFIKHRRLDLLPGFAA